MIEHTGIDIDKLKTDILAFTRMEVQKFITAHNNETFYAFAFDCDLGNEGFIGLCFNTEEEFAQTLEEYQKGEFSEDYTQLKNINNLKYNPGNWKYQCFASIQLLEEEVRTAIENNLSKLRPPDIDDAYNDFLDDLLDIVSEVLIEFSETELCKKIPKTSDFKIYSIEHAEDMLDAESRMKRLKSEHK